VLGEDSQLSVTLNLHVTRPEYSQGSLVALLALDHLAHRAHLRYLHRPANLEDVFLKLTGREMRD